MTPELDSLTQPATGIEPAHDFVAVAARSNDEMSASAIADSHDAAGHGEHVDARLDQLLHRINQLRVGVATSASTTPERATGDENVFFPMEPCATGQARFDPGRSRSPDAQVSAGPRRRQRPTVADQIKLPFILIEELLRQLKIGPMDRPSRRGRDERLSTTN